MRRQRLLSLIAKEFPTGDFPNLARCRHPYTIKNLLAKKQRTNGLGYSLQGQKRYAEAEDLNRRALRGREQHLGIQHPDTMKSVSDLSCALRLREA
ncbi:hypothetical protein PG988_015128 [Apiospora saccharicola]